MIAGGGILLVLSSWVAGLNEGDGGAEVGDVGTEVLVVSEESIVGVLEGREEDNVENNATNAAVVVVFLCFWVTGSEVEIHSEEVLFAHEPPRSMPESIFFNPLELFSELLEAILATSWVMGKFSFDHDVIFLAFGSFLGGLSLSLPVEVVGEDGAFLVSDTSELKLFARGSLPFIRIVGLRTTSSPVISSKVGGEIDKDGTVTLLLSSALAVVDEVPVTKGVDVILSSWLGFTDEGTVDNGVHIERFNTSSLG